MNDEIKIKGTSKFPKIYRIGAEEVDGILSGPIEVTEKLDGSQFGFGIKNGELICRSKGSYLQVGPRCTGLFLGAVETVVSIKDKLHPEWFYYGEAIQTKRHNKLTYDTIPRGHIALFGIKREDGVFVDDYRLLQEESERLGIGIVPLIYSGVIDYDNLEKLLEKPSAFGAQYMEGVVIKNYSLAGKDSKSLMVAKLVSDSFREVKVKKRPRGAGKTSDDKLKELYSFYHTTARFDKAIQHLRESGVLRGDNSDIRLLIQEIQRDLLEEERENIKNALFVLFQKDLLREVVSDFAEYYMTMDKSFIREGIKD